MVGALQAMQINKDFCHGLKRMWTQITFCARVRHTYGDFGYDYKFTNPIGDGVYQTY